MWGDQNEFKSTRHESICWRAHWKMTDRKSEQRGGWSVLILSRSRWNWANTRLGGWVGYKELEQIPFFQHWQKSLHTFDTFLKTIQAGVHWFCGTIANTKLVLMIMKEDCKIMNWVINGIGSSTGQGGVRLEQDKRFWVQIIGQIIWQSSMAQTFGMNDRLVNKLRVG